MLPDISCVCSISHILLDAGLVSCLFQFFFATRIIRDGCLINVDVEGFLHAVTKFGKIPYPNEKQIDMDFYFLLLKKSFFKKKQVPNLGPTLGPQNMAEKNGIYI